MLYEKKFVDENKLRKIKQLIYEENEEIFTLFTLFTKYGKDLKKLYTQLGPIIENTQTNFEKNETTISQRTGGLSKKGSKRDSSYNNTVLNAIIDSIEDQFESKNDLKVVKRLILCDNEPVLRALEEYEIDGDQKKLVNTLNFLIIKYRKRLSKSHPSFNPQASILDLKVNSSPEEENKSLNEEELNQLFTKIIKKIKKKLTSCTNLIRFDYSSIFLFDIETMNNEQKRTLFFDVFNINPDDLSLSSSFVDDVNKYYKAIVQNKILSDLNIQEIQIYNLLIEQKDVALIEIFEDNMKKHNIEGLKKKIKKYIQQIMQDNIKEGNEDEEEEKSSSVPSVSKEESSGYIIKKKNQKEKTTSILQYKYENKKTGHSNHSQKRTNTIKSTKTNESKKDTVNKKLNDFVKVINSMAFSENDKKQILDMLTNHNEKMIKIFENFQKNKLSLTKKIIIEAISSQIDNKTDNFNDYINKLVNKGEIDQKISNFLIHRYNQKDELLCSLWEVFCQEDDESDFIYDIKLYIKKYQKLIDNFNK